MSALLLAHVLVALRGAVAVGVLTTLVGGVPRLVQVGVAALVGLWSAMLVGPGAVPADLADVLAIGARELILGATLGIVAALPLIAAATAGRLIDLANGTRGPYAALVSVLAAAVFVGIDGHVMVIETIVRSHREVPALGGVEPRVVGAIASLFGAAVRLAVPWLVAAAVVELGVGVGTRVAGRSALALPGAVAVPAALAMVTATLVATLAVAIAALVRGTLP